MQLLPGKRLTFINTCIYNMLQGKEIFISTLVHSIVHQ